MIDFLGTIGILLFICEIVYIVYILFSLTEGTYYDKITFKLDLFVPFRKWAVTIFNSFKKHYGKLK
jgi:hypothetical protein